MAEGLEENHPGGAEAEAPEASVGGADAAAMALAMEGARHDPAFSRKAADYLARQGRLVDEQAAMLRLQLRHFAEDRRLDAAAANRKAFSERLRNGLEAFLALVAGGVVVMALAMLIGAATSRSVVVDAFAAPPAMAARGVTGQVVATRLLDQLQILQGATRSATHGLAVTSAWASDVRIEVPQTGISVGEIDRLLHQRLGRDLHIGGDVVQTQDGGVALSVRGDSVPARTFIGGAGDIDRLARQAAEYVYGRAQPFQFATYLVGNGRAAEALAFLPGAYARAPDDEARARLANVWGNAFGSLNRPAEAATKYRLATALAPYNFRSWGNLVGAVQSSEGQEAAWREARALTRAAAKAPDDKKPNVGLLGNVAIVTEDLPLELASLGQDTGNNHGAGAQLLIDGPIIADIYAQLHDPASADRYLSLSDPDDAATKAETLFLAGDRALALGDVTAALPSFDAFWKAWLADPTIQYTFGDNACDVALAYSVAGRGAEAATVFARVGRWARCYALHGDMLEHAGDLAGAERIWQEGITVGPDLSPVYLHRGLSELTRGDLAAAAADLAAANARSPHWADPLKAWGDLLARQGRWRDALAKYDEALKYAPAWRELHEARDAAQRRIG